MFVEFFHKIFLPVDVSQPNIFNNFNKLKFQGAINKTKMKKKLSFQCTDIYDIFILSISSHLFLSYLSLLLKRVNIKYGENEKLPSNRIYHIFILSIRNIKVELNYYNIFFIII